MASNTAWATSLLDEAAAIVEAEWMRLQQDEALWEREVADLFAEMPAPRPGPPRVGVTTTQPRWSGQPLPDCLLYTSPSPRDKRQSRMPSSA